MCSSSFGQPAARRGIQSKKLPQRLFLITAFDGEQGVGARLRPAVPRPSLYPKNMGCALLDWIRRDSANSNGLEEEQNNDVGLSCRPLNSVRAAMIGPKLESSSIVSKLMRFMPVSNERALALFPHPINPRCSLVTHFHISSLPFPIPSFRSRLNKS